jgi:hypothetical protein
MEDNIMTLIKSKDILHKGTTQGTVIVRVDTYEYDGKTIELDVWANLQTGVIDWSLGDNRVVGGQA